MKWDKSPAKNKDSPEALPWSGMSYVIWGSTSFAECDIFIWHKNAFLRKIMSTFVSRKESL